MNTIDWQFIFNLITAITSIIAIIFTCFSVLSAKKQEFELNRGNVVAYIDYDIVYTNAFLVVKNFGKSIATINSIKPNIDIPVYIDNNSDKYKIYNYSNYTLVPNQKVYNQIDIKKILGKTINIKCTYTTLNKTITSNYICNLDFVNTLSHSTLSSTSTEKALLAINKSIISLYQTLK